MLTESRRYRFAPLERRGLLLGLGGAQLATIGLGFVLALLVMRSGSPTGGLVAAGTVLAVAGALACWPVAGKVPVAWLPVVVAWLLRRSREPRRSPLPLAGICLRRSAGGDALRVAAGDAGLVIRGVRVLDVPTPPGASPLGVVQDTATGMFAAVLGVEGRSLALLDGAEKERRLAAWGALLATVARPGSPVARVQWVERSSGGSSGELEQYLMAAVPDAPPVARESYADVVAGAGPASQHRVAHLVVAVHPRKAGRALRGFGRGERAVCELLQRELRLLRGQAGGADLPVLRPLDPAALVDALTLGDGHAPRPVRGLGAGGHRPGGPSRLGPTEWLRRRSPLAVDDGWAMARVDGAWFATYWIAEWPRLDVGPDFLSPLLLHGGRRAISLVMAPVDPERAVREVGSARTADLADEELRRRAGFIPSTRRRREAEGVAQREAELADGHADYRFSGYVTVAGDDPRQLETSCAEVEQAARRAHLELRRLYGRQEEALGWTLPLGRGLS